MPRVCLRPGGRFHDLHDQPQYVRRQRNWKKSSLYYWVLLTWQVEQQVLGVGQAFLVAGQVLEVAGQALVVGHCLVEQQPVMPRDAIQTTERRVRMDFIFPKP